MKDNATIKIEIPLSLLDVQTRRKFYDLGDRMKFGELLDKLESGTDYKIFGFVQITETEKISVRIGKTKLIQFLRKNLFLTEQTTAWVDSENPNAINIG